MPNDGAGLGQDVVFERTESQADKIFGGEQYLGLVSFSLPNFDRGSFNLRLANLGLSTSATFQSLSGGIRHLHRSHVFRGSFALPLR